MELEDIIYIAATIVIFVISLLGSKKKKKNVISENKNSEQVEYSLNDFEKILERKQIVEEQENQHEEELTEAEEESIDHIPENYHFTEDESSKENIEDKKINKDRFEDENEDGFDLKSAIVYSSILERKKYRH